jgi:hypothetical protein
MHLLHLSQHRSLHIRQKDGDGLHLTTSCCSNRSSFSAIATLQKADTFKQRLLIKSSNARCGDRRNCLENTPPFPQVHPTAAHHRLGASPAGSPSARGRPAQRGERRRIGGSARRGRWPRERLDNMHRLSIDEHGTPHG